MSRPRPRPPRARGLRRGALGVLLLLSAAALPACHEENPHPPDLLLQDSLGLTLEDRVHRVVVESREGGETLDPQEVVIEPGSYVEFFTLDRRVRTVSFLLDSLGAEQAEFLRATGQDRSPPLLELDSRFVVSFEGAPAGRYVFVVEGNDRPAHGAIRVERR